MKCDIIKCVECYYNNVGLQIVSPTLYYIFIVCVLPYFLLLYIVVTDVLRATSRLQFLQD